MATKPKVLLTGGSGFIAAHILEMLLEKGYRVVTTVRGEDKAQKIRGAYPNLGSDRLDVVVVPDIARPDAFDEVVKTPGIELVLHTASPFHFGFDNPKELIEPAVVGTTSILKAIARSAPSVRRVVVTSSFASIVDPKRAADPSATFSEDSWNPIALEDVIIEPGSGREPAPKMDVYRASKKFAEKAAWEFVRGVGDGAKATFDLVTICPPIVFGPVAPHFASLSSVNTSNERIVDLVTGKVRESGSVLPDNGALLVWVDVRDVAAAHVRALEEPRAGGKRLFVTAGPFSNREIYDVVKRRFPEDGDRLPTEDEVKGGEAPPPDKRYRFDNSVTNEILGIKFRSLEESVVDTVKSFKAVGA